MLDASTINTIVGGATQLTTSLLGFGAGIYAANHQQVPDMGEFNYNITLPPPKTNSTSTLQTLAIIAVLLIIVFFGIYLVVKKA